jgi:hypothetical protein
MFIHSITIDEKGTLMGEWNSESEFRTSQTPIRTWVENSTTTIFGSLNEVFERGIPIELRSSFAIPYAIVRVLVEADQYELAKSVISDTEVPEDLQSIKQELIDLLS